MPWCRVSQGRVGCPSCDEGHLPGAQLRRNILSKTWFCRNSGVRLSFLHLNSLYRRTVVILLTTRMVIAMLVKKEPQGVVILDRRAQLYCLPWQDDIVPTNIGDLHSSISCFIKSCIHGRISYRQIADRLQLVEVGTLKGDGRNC